MITSAFQLFRPDPELLPLSSKYIRFLGLFSPFLSDTRAFLPHPSKRLSHRTLHCPISLFGKHFPSIFYPQMFMWLAPYLFHSFTQMHLISKVFPDFTSQNCIPPFLALPICLSYWLSYLFISFLRGVLFCSLLYPQFLE